MSNKEVKEGDQVSWQWSGSRPGGTVAEVATKGNVAIETQRGNEVKRNAEPNNPAVRIERSGNDVVKKASEVAVEKAGDKHKEDQGEEKTVTEADVPAEKQGNGEAQTGEKRKPADAAEEKKDEESGGDAKKQKTDGSTTNGEKAEAPKKKGRPAKGGANGASAAPKKEVKKREPKKAATEDGKPRRSGRVASQSS